MHIYIKMIGIALSLIVSGLTFAEPTQEAVNLDKFFRYEVNIKALVKNEDNKVLNLMAQMQDPNRFTDNINQFDQFIGMGSEFLLPDRATVMTEFNKNQKIQEQAISPFIWVGVLPFLQTEIPKMSFQDGLVNAKRCMEKQGHTLPNQIARFVLFRANIASKDFSYDYVFRDPTAPENVCQEVIYLPEHDVCNFGLTVNCHFDIKAGTKH